MGGNKFSVNTLSVSNLQYSLQIDLSKDVVFHVIFENIKFEVHSYGLHFSKKLLINKIISKKPSGTRCKYFHETRIIYLYFNIVNIYFYPK